MVKLVRNTKTLEDIFLEATSDAWLSSIEEEAQSEEAVPEMTEEEETEEKEASEDVSDL